MNNQDETRKPDRQLEQENEELKEVLKKEFGMREFGGEMSPQLENAWLKSIHAFEKTLRDEQREQTKESLSKN